MRRITLVSTDAELIRAVHERLGANGWQLETAASLEAIDAGPRELCVVHVAATTELAYASLPGCPIVVAVADAKLDAIVEVAHRSERAIAIVPPRAADIAELVTRALADDLGKPEQRAHTEIVADFRDMTRCLNLVATELARLDLPRRRREEIAQCVDELMMNALYDAPVDARGKPLFAGVPTRERVRMRTAERALVSWSAERERFVVSVSDAFGALTRDTVLRHLDRGLRAPQAVEQKVGGAGLGLFLIASAASELVFEVMPGVATRVTCVFEHATVGLARWAWLTYDAGARRRTRPARRRLATRYRARRALLAASIIAVVIGGGFAGYRAFGPRPPARLAIATTPGAQIELDGRSVGDAADGTFVLEGLVSEQPIRVTARLEGCEPRRTALVPHAGDNTLALALPELAAIDLDSAPSGATVELDGHPAGTTPLHLTTLAPGATVAVALALPGYQPATTRLTVPARGKTLTIRQPLAPGGSAVRVHLVSDPPGALVVREGQPVTADHTYTPADVWVEPAQIQRFTLTMLEHAALVIPPFAAPRGSPPLEKGGALPPP